MLIDLSDRIIQPATKKIIRLHPLRRFSQLALGTILVILPLINGIRIDITSGRFWLLGQTYTAQNLILLFYGCSVGALLLLTVSMIYGRWWCGWICPQTLASDFGDSLLSRYKTLFKSLHGKIKQWATLSAWSFTMLAMALATAAVVCSYFYPPERVWASVLHPLTDSRVSIHVAIITAVIGADLLWVRRSFCRRGCPYGLMLSLIADKNTMTVRYLDERDDDCIHCGKCEVVCPMSIDIKNGANQMECIGCGECIDACNDILPMIKTNPKPGLIELRYGLALERISSNMTILQRIGLWDLRRIFVISTLLILIGGWFFEMFGTLPTTVIINPSGLITQSRGFIYEHYNLTIANGRPTRTRFSLSATGPEQIKLLSPNQFLNVARSSQRTFKITIAAPIGKVGADHRYPVNIIVRSMDGSNECHSVTTIFYVPEPSAQMKEGYK